MRLIHYSVFNKNTNEKVYTDCRLAKVQAFLEGLENQEQYKIVYQWKSI